MVLHHVLDDAKFTQVATVALSTERLLEGEDDADGVFPGPVGAENSVSRPQQNEVLDHLLAQVVVHAVNLAFTELEGEVVGKQSELCRCLLKSFSTMLQFQPSGSCRPVGCS